LYKSAFSNCEQKKEQGETIQCLKSETIYRGVPVSADSVSAVSVLHSLPWPEKEYWKIK
jgi:hypothetical protein